nr:MAG TPA: hypothetical protein [Caudoviricetes sp.]
MIIYSRVENMGIFNKIKNAVVKSLLGRNINFHQKNFL